MSLVVRLVSAGAQQLSAELCRLFVLEAYHRAAGVAQAEATDGTKGSKGKGKTLGIEVCE